MSLSNVIVLVFRYTLKIITVMSQNSMRCVLLFSTGAVDVLSEIADGVEFGYLPKQSLWINKSLTDKYWLKFY